MNGGSLTYIRAKWNYILAILDSYCFRSTSFSNTSNNATIPPLSTKVGTKPSSFLDKLSPRVRKVSFFGAACFSAAIAN
jgi:hypothetical protein